ncbi:MAG: hypothetical protein PVH11_04835 [Anaerolineae bacterium]
MKHHWLGLLFVVAMLVARVPVVGADDSCDRPGNLTVNCNFDTFSDRGGGILTPDGWAPWVAMGSPAFDVDNHGSAPGAPAQRIWSDGGSWTAGLLQQVPVTPGKGYTARIDWAAPSVPDIERRIGVDPFGGTDPLSPQVVWGPSEWAEVRMPNLYASAYAETNLLTVFVWTHHPRSYGADEIFLDAVTLIEDPNMPPRATATPVPSPTATRRPPTRTPTTVPATDTPTALPSTPTATPTATEAPTNTPTVTPPPTWTPTPVPPTPTATATLAPTATPTVTPVSVAKLARTEVVPSQAAASPVRSQDNGPTSVLLYIMGAALLGALVLGAVVLGLWLRQKGA